MWDGIERRKGVKMPPNFEPEGAFQGYVVAKLEDMGNRLNTLPCKTQDERIRETEQKISKIEGKASVYGAVMGFVAGIISKYILGK